MLYEVITHAEIEGLFGGLQSRDVQGGDKDAPPLRALVDILRQLAGRDKNREVEGSYNFV